MQFPSPYYLSFGIGIFVFSPTLGDALSWQQARMFHFGPQIIARFYQPNQCENFDTVKGDFEITIEDSIIPKNTRITFSYSLTENSPEGWKHNGIVQANYVGNNRWTALISEVVSSKNAFTSQQIEIQADHPRYENVIFEAKIGDSIQYASCNAPKSEALLIEEKQAHPNKHHRSDNRPQE
jgi:hypothetical protein